MSEGQIAEELRDGLRASWQRYVDMTVPLRPVLHDYCLRLTGDLWDAEDLAQDTLMRGFAKLGCITHEVHNPRAYLLRMATNAWIDSIRRREKGAEASRLDSAPRVSPPPTGEMHEASARLLELAPRERAAVLLKDVFDMSLNEIADILGTTSGAVKAALHRGRGHLVENVASKVPRASAPTAKLVDEFVVAYQAGDLSALLALVLDNATVENVGCGMEVGRDGVAPDFSFFHKVLEGHDEWPEEFRYESARVERVVFHGEPLAAWFVVRKGKEALEQIFRFEEREGRIAGLRAYAFCPETMGSFAEEIGVAVRTGLYRYPTPAPGEFY